MFEVQTARYAPNTVFAGGFPVVTDIVATDDDSIKALSPVKLAEGKAVKLTSEKSESAESEEGTEAAAADTLSVYGIAAEDARNGYIPVYLTGEFRKEALNLEAGITADSIKTAFRNIGIFIK